MQRFVYLVLILVTAIALAGCEGVTPPPKDPPVARGVSSEPNAAEAVSFEEAVVASLAEQYARSRTHAPPVVFEWRGTDSWWVGDHQVTTEEIRTLAEILDRHDKPPYARLRVPAGFDEDQIVAMVDLLKLSGIERVSLETPRKGSSDGDAEATRP
jgi:biopolymer transport protein ExbD